MNLIKKYLTFTSGRPKSDKIIESIKIVPFIFHFVLAFGLIIFCLKTSNIFYGILAVIFGWQAGWGMSIERFKISEREED